MNSIEIELSVPAIQIYRAELTINARLSGLRCVSHSSVASCLSSLYCPPSLSVFTVSFILVLVTPLSVIHSLIPSMSLCRYYLYHWWWSCLVVGMTVMLSGEVFLGVLAAAALYIYFVRSPFLVSLTLLVRSDQSCERSLSLF